MPAINFPASPSVNDTFTASGKTWKWNGTFWELVISGASVADGSVSTAKIADSAITNPKLASGAVHSVNIASGAVTAAKLGNDIQLTPPDGSITTAKVAANAITQAKLAANVTGITLTTTANRSTDIPSPFTAQFIFLTDTNTLQRWSGSAWTNVIASPPGAPTALSATLLSATSVSVAFTPGASAGATTTNYKYALSTNGGATYSEPIAVDPADFTSPITISGLTAGNTYHIKLKAVTDVGDSEFSSATSISIPTLTVQYLVIAGGGGGGAWVGAGGGAGGYRSSVSGENTGGGLPAEAQLTLNTSTTYSVIVGGGGQGHKKNVFTGSSGENTTFGSITSIGGGRGGSYDYQTGLTGGSGGGAGYASDTPGTSLSGTSGQGYSGGIPSAGGTYAGAGGGGAGGIGANGVSGVSAGNGGVGVQSSITGSSIFRAGGGGGGHNSGSVPGIGGNGGGGGGAAGTTFSGTGIGISGTANTGGGGGGAGQQNDSPVSTGGNGGSGVVILRYPNIYTITLGAGLAGSTTTVSSNKVTTITAGSGNVSWA